jgi:hypothetical protein
MVTKERLVSLWNLRSRFIFFSGQKMYLVSGFISMWQAIRARG